MSEMHLELILWVSLLKFYYAQGKKMLSYFVHTPPPKNILNSQGTEDFVNFLCKYCIYVYIYLFHTFFCIIWM